MILLPAIRGTTRWVVWRIARRRFGEIEGLENLPQDGPIVLVPNHSSYFDHFVVQVLVQSLRGTPVWFLTKRESFESRLPRPWATAWYGIPVDREAPAPDTLREVRRVLTSDDALCVYPEGTRGDGGPLREFRPGAFRFALAHGVPIVPVGLHGSADVLRKGDRWFRRGQVDVVFGDPLEVDPSLPKPRAAAELASTGRAVVEALVERAAARAAARSRAAAPARGSTLRPAQTPRVSSAVALDRAVVHALGDDGRLGARDLRRLRWLWSFVARHEGADLDLRVQRARLAALRAARLMGPFRLVGALLLRRRVSRLLDESPTHGLANYLAGRWCLAMPSLLGGGARRALPHFATATRYSDDPTRAAMGAASARVALGQDEQAAELLRQVIAETPVAHPHHDRRTARARRLLAELTGEPGAAPESGSAPGPGSAPASRPRPEGAVS
ncbi:lysophospholipid acyltransferase family protein [Frigoribacterium faeni]|uniref:1-acyl-sn-glycerol-3-phosphate acyltransferase n=1 Tax=Frigoribacterium faeni TaxID=145483 RepID=A0A7W3JFM9_9MICO|nr:lysophospholipid acyltransferase family protein [Frigoribacterium faeni]MBA8811930.1 1-acyl-sn-glycerol-3-phosphate acyltransferase [Frigoribacterium faeni]GEK83780.1 hypothetical protein FFA01_20890 [Frigoribacterium faeni]